MRHATPHRRDAVQLAAGATRWWCELGGVNRKRECFEENMQTDAVPLLKDYAMYEATLPAQEGGVRKPLKLHQLPFMPRSPHWTRFRET